MAFKAVGLDEIVTAMNVHRGGEERREETRREERRGERQAGSLLLD